jgi:hypothetical protein
VIVDVEPGWVIADVFVIVKVKVFVWELNSQTTVAVENWPESTPVMVMVSARTVAALTIKRRGASKKISLPSRTMGNPPCPCTLNRIYTRRRRRTLGH